MGGINFAWLAVWVPSPDWPNCKLQVCNFFRCLGEATAPGGGECGLCPNFASYTLAFALQLRKITENLSQGTQNALGWSALNVICLADLAITGDGLDWPAGPCRPWLSCWATGSTLSQRKYQPSCCTRVSPHQLALSQSSQSGLWCGRQTAEHPDPRISACYVPGGTSSKMKTLGL